MDGYSVKGNPEAKPKARIYSDRAIRKDLKDHGDRIKDYQVSAYNTAEGVASQAVVGPKEPSFPPDGLLTPELGALGYEAAQMHIPCIEEDDAVERNVQGPWSYRFDRPSGDREVEDRDDEPNKGGY